MQWLSPRLQLFTSRISYCQFQRSNSVVIYLRNTTVVERTGSNKSRNMSCEIPDSFKTVRTPWKVARQFYCTLLNIDNTNVIVKREACIVLSGKLTRHTRAYFGSCYTTVHFVDKNLFSKIYFSLLIKYITMNMWVNK